MSLDGMGPTLWLRVLRQRLLFIGHLRTFRLRKPSVLFAFLIIVEMCVCHFKSLDMVMPG